MDEQILLVSLSGHFAAANLDANPWYGDLPGVLAGTPEPTDSQGMVLMLMQRTAAAVTVCGALAASQIFSSPVSAFEAADISDAFQSVSNAAEALIANGYKTAPALMLGLMLLAVVPLIAVMSPVVSGLNRAPDATRRYAGPARGDAKLLIRGAISNKPARAFVEIVGAADTHFTILRDMLRIGREDDNDICITSASVHRYHAAIHREQHDEWHITDLSGNSGNGIRVNGQRCTDALLRDGDVIELGPGRLRFRAGLI